MPDGTAFGAPSSGAHTDEPPERVWYAAYGSNCDERRLTAYLAGGVYAPTGVDHAGSADPTPPQGDAAWVFDRPLRFAGHSRAWGGATAVLADSPGRALGRIWLLSWRQFEDVLAQENATAHRRVSLTDARRGARVAAGGYARVLEVGAYQQLPVVTFTAAEPRAQPAGAPSVAYLRTIVRGLLAAHRLDGDEVADWLLGAEGLAGAWDRPALRALGLT